MLAGRFPYPESETDLYIRSVATRVPRPIRSIVDSIPAELEKICMKALAFSIEDRYSTCLEFAEDLARWREQNQLAVESSSRVPLAPQVAEERLPGNRRNVYGLMAVVTVVLGGLVFDRWTRYTPDTHETTSPTQHVDTITGDQAAPQPGNPEAVEPPETIDGWRQLLNREPRVVAWEVMSGRSAPHFDRERQRFQVGSKYSRCVHECGESNGSPFQMRTIIRVSDWVGFAGVFWGLREDPKAFPDKDYLAYAIEYYKDDKQEPSRLVFREIRMRRFDFETVREYGGSVLSDIPIPTPVQLEMPLDIDVQKRKVSVLWGTGQRWEPDFRLDTDSLLTDGQSAVGVTGQGADVEFRSLSIHEDAINP
ncbi:MAG: hypothetical protein DWH91_05015 [Planctomycetota bacterium]|nr:MAG: hypothetical protein DWH91_05015 [Planctomycetota bacterium]